MWFCYGEIEVQKHQFSGYSILRPLSFVRQIWATNTIKHGNSNWFSNLNRGYQESSKNLVFIVTNSWPSWLKSWMAIQRLWTFSLARKRWRFGMRSLVCRRRRWGLTAGKMVCENGQRLWTIWKTWIYNDLQIFIGRQIPYYMDV